VDEVRDLDGRSPGQRAIAGARHRIREFRTSAVTEFGESHEGGAAWCRLGEARRHHRVSLRLGTAALRAERRLGANSAIERGRYAAPARPEPKRSSGTRGPASSCPRLGVGQENEPLAPVRACAGGPEASSPNPVDSGATDSVDAAASAADSAATEPA
jgi:hypothetical protein